MGGICRAHFAHGRRCARDGGEEARGGGPRLYALRVPAAEAQTVEGCRWGAPSLVEAVLL